MSIVTAPLCICLVPKIIRLCFGVHMLYQPGFYACVISIDGIVCIVKYVLSVHYSSRIYLLFSVCCSLCSIFCVICQYLVFAYIDSSRNYCILFSFCTCHLYINLLIADLHSVSVCVVSSYLVCVVCFLKLLFLFF